MATEAEMRVEHAREMIAAAQASWQKGYDALMASNAKQAAEALSEAVYHLEGLHELGDVMARARQDERFRETIQVPQYLQPQAE